MVRIPTLVIIIAVIFVSAGSCVSVAETLTLSLEAPDLSSPGASTNDSTQAQASPAPKPRLNAVTVGKVGVVSAPKASIYRERSGGSRVYANVKQETPLAIVKDEGDWYGVLMVNGATGWISKHLVRLTGYELVKDKKPQPARGSFTSRGGTPDRPGSLGEAVVRSALDCGGIRYVFGGTSPTSGMDCSAFVRMLFSKYGVKLPRTAREQARVGEQIPLDQLQPGDRLYFQCKNSYIDHCGIYAGNGYFVHCSASQKGVAVDSLASDFYWRSLVTARRS